MYSGFRCRARVIDLVVDLNADAVSVHTVAIRWLADSQDCFCRSPHSPLTKVRDWRGRDSIMPRIPFPSTIQFA